MIIQDHNTTEYLSKQEGMLNGKHNGAYYYSKEIVESFIPVIKTDYNWQTIMHAVAPDNCIVFVHANNNLKGYDKFLRYTDVILVCSTTHSVDKLKERGHKQVIYVPLSIDTEYLDKFKSDKKRGTIACGNVWAFTDDTKEIFRKNKIKHYHDIEREELLTKMGYARTIYAIGRTAMEAIYLGAEVIQPDKEYPVMKYSRYYTQAQAIEILQSELDRLKRINNTKESINTNTDVIVTLVRTNDNEELLQKVLKSLITQTIVPDKIYITDSTNFSKPLLEENREHFYFIMNDELAYNRNYVESTINSIRKHKKVVTYGSINTTAWHTSYYYPDEIEYELGAIEYDIYTKEFNGDTFKYLL